MEVNDNQRKRSQAPSQSLTLSNPSEVGQSTGEPSQERLQAMGRDARSIIFRPPGQHVLEARILGLPVIVLWNRNA